MGAPVGGKGALSDEAMTVVWLDESASSDDSAYQALAQLALSAEQVSKSTVQLKLDHYAPVRISDDDPQTTQDTNAKGADDANAAAMLGRYMGQVTARIERAWIRPRTGVSGGEFQCRVRIEQDRLGTVKEVTLQRCNGDTRWQLSLVRAIESASPLPAPPDPGLFTRLVTLELSSAAFESGSSRDGFETEGSRGGPPKS
jgi:membrane protein involved in colicin uptake